MASPLGDDARRARLVELAAHWGVNNPAPVVVNLPSPSPRSASDDFNAEELLKRRRAAANASKNSKWGFNSNKKTWDPKEIFEAIDAHVASAGSPGVADALINRLRDAGGDVNLCGQKVAKTNGFHMKRRISMESMERSRILQKAIQNRHAEMVAVLVKYADAFTLDTALPDALRSTDPVMVQLFLQRGAHTLQAQDSKDAFRQMCIYGGHADLIGLVLQSEGRPFANWLSMAMVDAARKGCFQTVLRLSRASDANAEWNNAEALKEALKQGRVDLVLAILTGAKPPNPGGAGLAESFKLLFENPNIGPSHKMTLAEALLCAGASGNSVARALSTACDTEFYDMVELLVRYGAPLDYEDAKVVRNVVSRVQTALSRLLLSDSTQFSPIYASECVVVLPKTVAPEDRYAILNLLLRKGAHGTALHETLIDAAQVNDLRTIELLVNPRFPDAIPVKNGQRGVSVAFARHDVASVDYKDGMALSIAIQTNNLQMARLLLTGNPSSTTVDRVFPLVNKLQNKDRYPMAECLLAAGLTGPCISAALQGAIEEQPPRRDESYISLLIRHSSSKNVDGGAGVLSAIVIRDVALLESLLQKPQAHETLSVAMTKAMAIDDRRTRYHLIQLLIDVGGAGREGTEVSAALPAVLQVKPVDIQLATLLLIHGQADVNYADGAAVKIAVKDPDEAVFQLVLDRGKPNHVTLSDVLLEICAMPTTPARPKMVDAVIRKCPPKTALDKALCVEVNTMLAVPHGRRNMAVMKMLLSAGADLNFDKAYVLRMAVKNTDQRLLDILFSAKPTSASLASGLPMSTNIVDAMDRLTFTQKLIDAGAPSDEINKALVYAIRTHYLDHPLVGLLARHADSRGGGALKTAVEEEHDALVTLLLEKTPVKYSPAILSEIFVFATERVTSPGKRVAICKTLLKEDVSGPVVSNALLAAASEGDVALGAVLMEYGADVQHNDGQAIIRASGAGNFEVLGMLLGTDAEVAQETLDRSFQAASKVDDLEKRAAIFRLLLEKGVRGELLDMELIAAAKFGEAGEELVSLLLEFGACVDYNSGEAVWNTTRSASLGTLKLLLGIGKEDQPRPSSETLHKGLRASKNLDRDSRYQVIKWLFEAGLPASGDVNIALKRAVKDDTDLRLVRLLLQHGASPLANGCQPLIEAAQLLLIDVVEVMLETDVPQQDVSWTFQQVFTPQTANTWLSEQGLQVAQLLLQKGANAGLSPALSAAIDAANSQPKKLAFGAEDGAIAERFAKLLLQHTVDVSYDNGVIVCKAAQRANTELMELILKQNPDSRAVSMAFPHLFDSDLSEEEILRVVGLFTDYHHGEERLDVMFPDLESNPIIFRAIDKYPRSVKLLEALLDAGYYHDQTINMRVMEEIDENALVTVLLWALLQPQKRISSAVIKCLIDRGANVKYETPTSKTTALMLAIRAKRTDLVGALILAGADVNVADATGNTPMTMATKVGGEIGTSIMGMILAADPSPDDGSLHNAARELNLEAVQVLIQYGHDLDFPSPIHDGRTALGELCLNAAHAGPLTAADEKTMEKIMTLLIKSGTDLTLQVHGKSVLLFALHSADPLPTTRTLLRVGYWKLLNKPFNHFTDGTFTYSPTQYLLRVIPESDHKDALITLLLGNRAQEVYYANDGPQPPGAVNLPEELLRAERDRRAREERIARETEEHKLALARTQEIATLHDQIFKNRATLEDSRARRVQDAEIANIRERQAIAQHGFAEELKRREAEREASVRHEQKLLEAGLSRTRLIAEADMEREQRKHEMAIGWEKERTAQAVSNARQLSEVRVREREAVERFDKEADGRLMRKIQEQKRLVDSQNVLAGQLASGGQGRRQIGFVEEMG